MTPPRTLLAATDFSAHARHALERAAQLASVHADTTLTITHVICSSALAHLRHLLPGDATAIEAGLREQAERTLQEQATQLLTKFPCNLNTRLLQGSALSSLTGLADSENIDLMVMGTRGAHFVREVLLGSTTERVLRKLRRPLLAVKQRPLSPYRRVLCPVDFSAHAAAAINAAYAWLPNAEFMLLHAYEVELESTFRFAGLNDEVIHQYRIQAHEAAHVSMDEFATRLKVPAAQLTRQFMHGAPTLRILEQEQAFDADLIVIGKHGQTVMEELLLGSVTKHVLTHSSSDVFVSGLPA